MRRQSYRYQRTVARPVEVRGIGFLTGALVRLAFKPAPPHHGVVFARADLGPLARIPACISQVTGTQRRTTLGQPPNQVSLVEHVLAALSGLRIDNCLVELNACEPPGLDGSARHFVDALLRTGITLQSARRPVWVVHAPVVVRQQGATLSLYPSEHENMRASYFLDYGDWSPIDRQVHSQDVTPEGFANDLASCRTFILESEIKELRRQGLGVRTKMSDLLVFGRHGLIHNQLRYANEPARHKILDLIGDLALLGQDIRGHVVAYRSGHPLNVELVRELAKQLPQHADRCPRQAA